MYYDGSIANRLRELQNYLVWELREMLNIETLFILYENGTIKRLLGNWAIWQLLNTEIRRYGWSGLFGILNYIACSAVRLNSRFRWVCKRNRLDESSAWEPCRWYGGRSAQWDEILAFYSDLWQFAKRNNWGKRLWRGRLIPSHIREIPR